jgi:hypothetical protein
MLGRPSPWHELIDASGGPEIDELRQHVGPACVFAAASLLASSS